MILKQVAVDESITTKLCSRILFEFYETWFGGAREHAHAFANEFWYFPIQLDHNKCILHSGRSRHCAIVIRNACWRFAGCVGRSVPNDIAKSLLSHSIHGIADDSIDHLSGDFVDKFGIDWLLLEQIRRRHHRQVHTAKWVLSNWTRWIIRISLAQHIQFVQFVADCVMEFIDFSPHFVSQAL